MKLKNLFWGVCAAAMAVFTACEPEEVDLGTPSIAIDKYEMAFDSIGGEQTLAVTATRDWKVETDAEWVTVSPESGEGSLEPQIVTVTALENTGMDRSADLTFTIGMMKRVLTVSQTGPDGSAEDLIVYFNDFDKEEATKSYGNSGSSWPYLDQFEGWKNATGTGEANVEYAFNGMSARANSTSNSNYSDYAGSGKNNMFFGKEAYLATNNIALNGVTGLTLTFGTEKYSQDNGSVFQNSEFHIFLSQDGAKWVELIDYTFAGDTVAGRWNIATANFSVPEGTENLSICMQVDVASSYRMDDMKLVVSEGGAAVDFTKGVEKDFTAGADSGSNPGTGDLPEGTGEGTFESPYDAAKATKVASAMADGETKSGVYVKGIIKSIKEVSASYGNASYYLTDEDGVAEFYVFRGRYLNEEKFTSEDQIKVGDEVVVFGDLINYMGNTPELSQGNYIVMLNGEGAGEFEAPQSQGEKTVADFVTAADVDNYYTLSGVVSNYNSSYCSFDLTDETGKIYVYSVLAQSKSQWVSQIANGDTITIYGKYAYYDGGGDETKAKHEVVDAYIVSCIPGEGGNEGGEDPVTPPADGEYEPNITWTLGTNAYDNTSKDNNKQSATVNGVAVNNLLKIGTSKAVGDATLHIPAGTTKLGFYCVAWNKKEAKVKFSVGGTEITTIEPKANTGAANNAPYTINVADTDYYEIKVSATEATDVKVETLDATNGRAIFIGFKAE